MSKVKKFIFKNSSGQEITLVESIYKFTIGSCYEFEIKLNNYYKSDYKTISITDSYDNQISLCLFHLKKKKKEYYSHYETNIPHIKAIFSKKYEIFDETKHEVSVKNDSKDYSRKIVYNVEDGYEHFKVVLKKRNEQTYWVACVSSNPYWGYGSIKAKIEDVNAIGMVTNKETFWVFDFDIIDNNPSYKIYGNCPQELFDFLISKFAEV